MTEQPAKRKRREGTPRNTHWSWRALVAQCGGDEDQALALLQYMPGLGQYTDDATRGWASGAWYWRNHQLEPKDEEVHDELPRCLLPVPEVPWLMETSTEQTSEHLHDYRVVNTPPIDHTLLDPTPYSGMVLAYRSHRRKDDDRATGNNGMAPMSVGSKRGFKQRGRSSHHVATAVARMELGDGIVSRCFSRSGEPKRGFVTRDQARRALKVARKTYARTEGKEQDAYRGMRPYHCSGCGYFHLGHYRSDGGRPELSIEGQLGEMRRAARAARITLEDE